MLAATAGLGLVIMEFTFGAVEANFLVMLMSFTSIDSIEVEPIALAR